MVEYSIRVLKGNIMFKTALRKISIGLAIFVYNIKYRIKVVGKENIPTDGGLIVCANHRKAEDPILVYVASRVRYINYFAKKALTEKRLIKWYLVDVLGIRPVSHSGSDIGAIKWGLSKLKAGEAVGIFPEGTRNRTDADLLELQHGAAVLAHMSKAKVVTATINCTRKWFSKCEVVFSEPLDLGNEYALKLDDGTKASITQKIRENLLKSLKK